eukprot:13319487-Heterocapsa_arctica.AAC.1
MQRPGSRKATFEARVEVSHRRLDMPPPALVLLQFVFPLVVLEFLLFVIEYSQLVLDDNLIVVEYY